MPTGESGWEWVNESWQARILAEGLTEDECRHLSGLSAPDAVAWCEAMAKPAKTRPQPGDVVPWAEVEDGALYFDGYDCMPPFLAVFNERCFWLYNDDDKDLELLLKSGYGCNGLAQDTTDSTAGVLVSRDLGSDPEAWRKAMREWTANGNKPAVAHAVGPGFRVNAMPMESDPLMTTLRAALGCESHDDIVVHARKVKARAVENERILASLTEITATADRRMKTILELDARDDVIREVIGADEKESTEEAARRVKREHDLNCKAAAFEIKHLRDERDEARARVDSLRRHSDHDRPTAP